VAFCNAWAVACGHQDTTILLFLGAVVWGCENCGNIPCCFLYARLHTFGVTAIDYLLYVNMLEVCIWYWY
jgi:hypothetical protein